MSSSRDDWREFDRESRRAGGRILLWVLVIVLIVGLLSAGGWALKVALSDVKGRGDAVIQKNSATNRIGAQEQFEDLYAEVRQTADKIAVLQAAVEADPTAFNKTNLTGAQTYCLGVVADYNAAARKYTKAQFRASDLPPSLSAADCEGTIQ